MRRRVRQCREEWSYYLVMSIATVLLMLGVYLIVVGLFGASR